MKNTKNKNVNGQKYNRLTIMSDPYRKNNRTYVQAQCDCTNVIEAQLYKIQSNHTQGCGCEKQKLRTHNLSKHPLYRIWEAMKYRCNNSNASNYLNYGGRGIRVCENWSTNFVNFYDWAMQNNWNKDLEIDRIQNDLGYSENNCRLVSAKDNARNRRNIKYVSFGTILMPLFEAIESGMINKNKFYKNENYRNSFTLFGDIAS
jgi:hypothetical protein